MAKRSRPRQHAAGTPQSVRAKIKKTASVFSYPRILPDELVERVEALQQVLKKEVWLFVHPNTKPIPMIHHGVFRAFVAVKDSIPKQDLALVVNSFGGNGEAAYRISALLKRRCPEFVAIIPAIAKSAATLLVLGADKIILGEDAELGPLDAQYPDYDVEEQMVSALDTVQAVDQLEDASLALAVKMLKYLHQKTRKKYNVLLRHALHFTAEITKPLFDKIDSLKYCRHARVLREAQDYAERLLQPKFSEQQAKAIAKDLVTNYPTHEFVIDLDEAKRIGVILDEQDEPQKPVGLHAERPKGAVAEHCEWLYHNLGDLTAFGKLVAAT